MSDLSSEVFQKKIADYSRGLNRFAEALELPKDTAQAYLDTSIHRFVFCYEMTWKNLRRLLRMRAVQVNSPVMTFREAVREQLISIEDKKIFEQMIVDRNMATHEYVELKAHEIYSRLPEYLRVFQKTAERMEKLYFNNELGL